MLTHASRTHLAYRDGGTHSPSLVLAGRDIALQLSRTLRKNATKTKGLAAQPSICIAHSHWQRKVQLSCVGPHNQDYGLAIRPRQLPRANKRSAKACGAGWKIGQRNRRSGWKGAAAPIEALARGIGAPASRRISSFSSTPMLA